MKKIIIVLSLLISIFACANLVNAETLPVEDVYCSSTSNVYVLLQNGVLLYGNSIDTPNPQVITTNVKKMIDYEFVLHNDGTIDKLSSFVDDKKNKFISIEYTLDFNAIDIIQSKSNEFLYIDESNSLYKYDTYTKESLLLFENVKSCKRGSWNRDAYVLTLNNELYYINYNNNNKTKSELALNNVLSFSVHGDDCYALKKNGDIYYEYSVSVDLSGKLILPERKEQYNSLEEFDLKKQYDLALGSDIYKIDVANLLFDEEKTYICNKNFYFTSDGTVYKAKGQIGYERYIKNVKTMYIASASNFNNLYLFVTKNGQLFAAVGKINRTHGTDKLDSPYITSFCEKNTKVIINNEEVRLETKIQIVNNRSMYPFRECLENMGALVMWDSKNRIAIGEYNGITVEFPIDKNYYYINGKIHYMDTTSYISNGRTYIPIRFAAEALGFAVEWESTSFENIISIFE